MLLRSFLAAVARKVKQKHRMTEGSITETYFKFQRQGKSHLTTEGISLPHRCVMFCLRPRILSYTILTSTVNFITQSALVPSSTCDWLKYALAFQAG